MVVHVCNLSTWEAKAELPQVQGEPGLCSGLNASLDLIARPCLNLPPPKNVLFNKKYNSIVKK